MPSVGPLELVGLAVVLPGPVLPSPVLIVAARVTVFLRSRGARAAESRRIEALESRVRGLERP